jgi:hypothetical protein
MCKYVKLDDFLTEYEIKLCQRQYKRDPLGFTRWVLNDVIQPNLERINQSLGQRNSAQYLAYVVTYIFCKTS